MTDFSESPQANVFAPPAVVDEAVAAAEGTRMAARWIASALGAIPSLAVLASIVRVPGESGFDAARLAVGVALAALGAIVGVLAFARVIAPVPLEDADIKTVDMRRIPRAPYKSFDELRGQLDKLRLGVTAKEYEAAESLVASEQAQFEADRADSVAKEAEEKVAGRRQRRRLVGCLAGRPSDVTLEKSAQQARADAYSKRREAQARAARAKAEGASLELWITQMSRADSVRHDAYRLKAAEKVGERFLHARVAAFVSVALIAAGIVMLGLAPEGSATAERLSRQLTPSRGEVMTGTAGLAATEEGGSAPGRCGVSPLSKRALAGCQAFIGGVERQRRDLSGGDRRQDHAALTG